MQPTPRLVSLRPPTRAIICLLASATVLCAVGAGPLDRDAKSLVKVQLLPSSTTAAPGKPITVGLKFTISKDWHIYWLNPGDSGMATAASLTLPPGWKSTPWRFPIPKRFDQPGNFEGFGYTDEVVLLTDITPPADFAGEASIGVTSLFLVCESVCLPGKDTQTLRLTAGEPVAANAETLRAWDANVPAPADDAVQATGTLGTAWSPFTAAIPAIASKPASIELFPLPPDGVELRNLKSATDADGKHHLSFEAKTYGGTPGTVLLPPTIPLLVVAVSTAGEKAGKWVNVPTGAPVAAPATQAAPAAAGH